MHKVTKTLSKKFISILLLFGILSSCSIIGDWWYKQLDNYLANYFFQYADFSSVQKEFISNTTKKFHRWHKRNELPKYKAVLLKLRRFNNTTSPGDVGNLYSEIFELFNSSNNFFLPYMFEFSKNLNDEQIIQIENHFDEIISERKGELTSISTIEYKEEIVKNSIKGFKRIGIKLSVAQKNEITKLGDLMMDLRKESLEAQELWNEEFIALLNTRKNEGFHGSLMQHLGDMRSMGGGALQGKQNKNRELFFQMFSQTLTTLDKKQTESYYKRIDFMIELIDEMKNVNS